jgi:hypothetical protein
MSVITEIARIPLQYVDIESSSTEAGKTFNELLDLLRNAKGSRRVLWSRQNERADVLEILIGTSCLFVVLDSTNSSRLGGLCCFRGISNDCRIPKVS